MNTKRFFLGLVASLACIVLTFVSCSSKDDNGSTIGDPVSPSEVAKYPYSSLTPEQQKEKLSGEANSFLSQVQDLSKEKGFDVFNAFNNLVNIDEPVIGGSSLKSAEDIIKINSFYGKFTWQASSQTWKEEQANQLEFNFPVGSSTGRIVITGVSSGKNYTYEEYYEDYDYNTGQWIEETETTTFELPKQLSAIMYLGGSEVSNIQVNADIVDTQSAPKSATVSFSFGSYKYNQNYEKSTGKVTASLSKGNNILINSVAILNGNVDNLINDPEYDGFSGNFTLQIMDNLAFAGNVDYANYNKEMNQLSDNCYPSVTPPNYDWDKADENYAEGSATIYNKYFDIYLVSTKDKTKIAKLTQKAVFNEYSYWDVTDVLNFNDSTQVEADVYFSEGFDLVMKNFNKFIQSFQ